jgi:hypothetical protein
MRLVKLRVVSAPGFIMATMRNRAARCVQLKTNFRRLESSTVAHAGGVALRH